VRPILCHFTGSSCKDNLCHVLKHFLVFLLHIIHIHILILMIEDINVFRLSEFLPDALSLEHQYQNRNKAKYTSHTSEEDKQELKADKICHGDCVERERHADFLPYKVIECRYLASLEAVAVDGISVASCCDYLVSKAGNSHAYQWTNPVDVVLNAETINQQSRWD